jgi:uncharacterized protein
VDTSPDDFREFRATREAELTEPYGWLTLRGFHWLDTEPVELPGLPGRWGAEADGSEAHLTAVAADGLTRDGAVVDGTSSLTVAEYARIPWVDLGDVRVELLRRGGRLAVRLRGATSPEREAFAGVPTYPYDPAWRLPATFTAYAEPRAVEVETIRADVRQVMHPLGEVTFIVAGEQQRLAVTKGKYGWGVEFRDPTNGAETEVWRQLHFDPPEPGSGGVVLDFNRSLNMWCAFTDYATCPAPIAGNVIRVPVRAGELRWR